MAFLVFVPLVFAAGICLVPACLLRRQVYARAQDYFVSSQSSPPAVIGNSSIVYALRMAAFGPFFAWGAGGDIWPAIISAAFFGCGLSLIYILRRPMLEFLNGALGHDRSITVHAFIARQHGNDPRVRLLAASLTLFAFFGLIVCEAIAVAALLKPLLMGNTALVYLSVLGMLTLTVLCTMLSGNSGVMHSAQLHLGVAYLGFFGSTALLLYLHVSALTPLPPHGTFAVVFVAAWCALILWYRRSKYVDTNLVRIANRSHANDTGAGRASSGAKLLKKFAQILNPCISVFVVLVVVVASMEFYIWELPAIGRSSIATLQTATSISTPALIALVLLPLFYPIVDVGNWQRMAAIEKDIYPSNVDPGRRTAALRSIVRIYGAESPLLWLFMCMFGAIAVVATETSSSADVMQAFMARLVSDQNEVTVVVLPLLLAGVSATALSTMMSMFSASLCTIRYDILSWFWPEPAAGQARPVDETLAVRRAMIAGLGLFLAIAAAFVIADTSLQISFSSSVFLALLFAFCCAQLVFLPLVLGPMLRRPDGGFSTVSPRWALAILGFGAASGACSVTIYAATGNEAWLWAVVPVCLGSGLILFTLAGLWPRDTP
jgi:hypothetical protein